MKFCWSSSFESTPPGSLLVAHCGSVDNKVVELSLWVDVNHLSTESAFNKKGVRVMFGAPTPS